jgi:hypothetical protein
VAAFSGFTVAILFSAPSTVIGIFGRPRHIYRTIDRLQKNAEAAGMVAVLERNNYRIKITAVDADLA